jgi:hypothetical protein
MTEVRIAPDDTAQELRDYVRAHPGVRKDSYAVDGDPVEGACYVLSEAYFHAAGGTDRFGVYRLDWSEMYDDADSAHWFLRDTDAEDTVIDLSLPTPADGDAVPWDAARHRAFITGYEPSNRAKRVLDALNIAY